MPGHASLPGPDLIGSFGQQFGLLINRVTALPTSFRNLAMGGEDPPHVRDVVRYSTFL